MTAASVAALTVYDMAKAVDCPTPLFTACVPIYSAAMARSDSALPSSSSAWNLGSPSKRGKQPQTIVPSGRTSRITGRSPRLSTTWSDATSSLRT